MGDHWSEESETTKSGTDGQEPYMRRVDSGKQAHHCDAQNAMSDENTRRCGRNQRKEDEITWGELCNHGLIKQSSQQRP